MPLATMTMKTKTHGFLNFYLRTVVMGLRSAALWAAGELRYYIMMFGVIIGPAMVVVVVFTAKYAKKNLLYQPEHISLLRFAGDHNPLQC